MKNKPYWVSAGLTIIVISLVYVSLGYRKDMIIHAPVLDIYFDHEQHQEVNCVSCHHNYADGTGMEHFCYACHKIDPEVNDQIEVMFHDFCRDCHVQKKIEGEAAGPVRACGECHRPDLHP